MRLLALWAIVTVAGLLLAHRSQAHGGSRLRKKVAGSPEGHALGERGYAGMTKPKWRIVLAQRVQRGRWRGKEARGRIGCTKRPKLKKKKTGTGEPADAGTEAETEAEEVAAEAEAIRTELRAEVSANGSSKAALASSLTA